MCWKLAAQGPPITLTAPGTLGLQGKAVRTFGTFVKAENHKIYTQVLAMPYNISTRLQLGAILRYSFLNPTDLESVNGFGDATLFAKYQFYQLDGIGKTLRLSGIIRQTFPTGKASTMPSIGRDIYQTYIGFIAGDISIKRGWYTNIGFNLTGGGMPDNFLYNFSYGLPVLPHQYPLKQLNLFLEWNGNLVTNSEVHSIFLSPGLQFIAGNNFLLESSFQIPLLQRGAEGNKTKYQLLIGTRILL